MSPIRTAVVVMMLAVVSLGWAAPVAKPPAAPTLDEVGAALQAVIDWEGIDDPKMTLREALRLLRNQYKVNIPFDFNDTAFLRAFGDSNKDIRDEVIGRIQAQRLPLAALLRRMLGKVVVASGASFLLRDGHVEVTTEEAIRLELKIPPPEKETDWKPLPFIIIYMNLDGATLESACEKIAERAGCSVLIDPRVKEKASTAIKARLINIPLDAAVELVADMAGLAVARKANAYYLTTPENAARLKGK
jgi:hypothetical protein